MTDDPQSQFPGPEIYDGGNIHGPPANNVNSVQKYHEYGADKADTYEDRYQTGNEKYEDRYQPTKYDDRYQATYTRPPPTLGAPTPRPSRLPPSKYDEIIPYRPYAPQDSRPGPNSYKPPAKDPYFEDVGVGPPPNDYSYENDIDKVSQSYHPDGPDYSTGTTVLKPFGSKGSVPFKVGLDLYPMVTGTSLSALGKQDIYSLPSSPSYAQGENNKHEIMLHLNLFSKKPSVLGGREQDIEIGPFTLSGRKEEDPEERPSMGGRGHPLFGNLNPFDILQHLLKKSRSHSVVFFPQLQFSGSDKKAKKGAGFSSRLCGVSFPVQGGSEEGAGVPEAPLSGSVREVRVEPLGIREVRVEPLGRRREISESGLRLPQQCEEERVRSQWERHNARFCGRVE